MGAERDDRRGHPLKRTRKVSNFRGSVHGAWAACPGCRQVPPGTADVGGLESIWGAGTRNTLRRPARMPTGAAGYSGCRRSTRLPSTLRRGAGRLPRQDAGSGVLRCWRSWPSPDAECGVTLPQRWGRVGWGLACTRRVSRKPAKAGGPQGCHARSNGARKSAVPWAACPGCRQVPPGTAHAGGLESIWGAGMRNTLRRPARMPTRMSAVHESPGSARLHRPVKPLLHSFWKDGLRPSSPAGVCPSSKAPPPLLWKDGLRPSSPAGDRPRQTE